VKLMTAKAEIRPASDAELATLVAVLGERHWFTDRLARQQRGGGVLLVAWLEGRPVGEVFLECEAAREPEVRWHLPGVPRLDHLEVSGPFQGRGIGTALIGVAEGTARRLGHERIALGVGLDNPKARRLYERLGYADWATEPLWGAGWSTRTMGHRLPSPRSARCSSSASDRVPLSGRRWSVRRFGGAGGGARTLTPLRARRF
jgi:GNAT superfamily N-acetyltransferase